MDVLKMFTDSSDGSSVMALTGRAGEVVRFTVIDGGRLYQTPLAEASPDAPSANCAVEGRLKGAYVYHWGTPCGLYRRARGPDGVFAAVEKVPEIQGAVVCLGLEPGGNCMGVRLPGGTHIQEISGEGALSADTRIFSPQSAIMLPDPDGRAVRVFYTLGKHSMTCAGPLGVGNCCELLSHKLWGAYGTFNLDSGRGAGHRRGLGHQVFTVRPEEEESQAVGADHPAWMPPAASTEEPARVLVATDPADKTRSGHEILYWTSQSIVSVAIVPWTVACFLQLNATHFAVGGRWPDGKTHDKPAFGVFEFPTPQT